MKLRYSERDPLPRIIHSQREEIEKYKWIKSEQEGHDIGWDRAAHEWTRSHFRNWRQHRLERDVLLHSWGNEMSSHGEVDPPHG